MSWAGQQIVFCTFTSRLWELLTFWEEDLFQDGGSCIPLALPSPVLPCLGAKHTVPTAGGFPLVKDRERECSRPSSGGVVAWAVIDLFFKKEFRVCAGTGPRSQNPGWALASVPLPEAS